MRGGRERECREEDREGKRREKGEGRKRGREKGEKKKGEGRREKGARKRRETKLPLASVTMTAERFASGEAGDGAAELESGAVCCSDCAANKLA